MSSSRPAPRVHRSKPLCRSTGRDKDRVYLLQFTQNKSRRFFFWLQEKEGGVGEDLAKKVNDELNPGGEFGRQLRTLRTLRDSERGSGAQALSLEHVQSAFSSLGMPPAAPGSSSSASDGPPAPPVTSDALANALSSMMNATPSLALGDVASPDAVADAGLFDDDAAVDRLLPHLPESQRTRAELQTILRAPQFRQALDQLTRALRSPENYESIMANFGLGSAAANSNDPVERFLAAIVSQAADAKKDGDGAADSGNGDAKP